MFNYLNMAYLVDCVYIVIWLNLSKYVLIITLLLIKHSIIVLFNLERCIYYSHYCIYIVPCTGIVLNNMNNLLSSNHGPQTEKIKSQLTEVCKSLIIKDKFGDLSSIIKTQNRNPRVHKFSLTLLEGRIALELRPALKF